MKAWVVLVCLGILAATVVGCSQDPQNPNELPSDLLATVSVGGVNSTSEGCVTLWAGQNIDAGTVCVSVIDEGVDEQLCITYTTTGNWQLVETHVWVGDVYMGYPQTRKGNPKIGNFPYHSGDITGATTWNICVPLSEWGTEIGDGSANDLCGKVLYVAAHAALQLVDDGGNVIQTETGWADGEPADGNSWATFFSVELTCSEEPPPADECETAFAYGNTCFLDIDEDGDGQDDFSRWGWSNGPLAPGTYTSDIYAGAGQCDITKGTLVGTLTVVYDGAQATVSFDMDPGYTMEETHLYVGDEILARDVNGEFTVAPGQYPFQHDLSDASTDSYVVSASGDIYVVAHAVVCGF